MNNHELAKTLIDQISDAKLLYVIPYLQGAALTDETPNAKTFDTIAEIHSMIKNDTKERPDGAVSDNGDNKNHMQSFSGEKQLLVEKYGLKHENHAWYSEKENSHKHLIFKDAFFERADIIGLLFRINKLCMAKVNYFRRNIQKYEPLKYDYRKGFLAVPLWDAEFLRHRNSGWILDFRYLQTITVYDDFVSLCRELESFEPENFQAGKF